MELTQQEAFEHYLDTRYAKADAITPGQKIEVIQTLRQETQESGRVPLSGGPVRVDVSNEAVQAALSGRSVSLDGGTAVKGKKPAATSAEGLAGMGAGAKIGILAGILLVPVLIAIFIFAGGGDDEETAPEPTAAVEDESSSMLGAIGLGQPRSTDTPTPAPTETPIPPSPTTEIPPTPQIIIVTPTPFPALQINERGSVAGEGNDPASIEIAGFAYILTTGSVSNGLWEPRGAEWLQGTELRRVVAVPYDPDLLSALFTMSSQETIKLRLRSGEIADYRLSEVARVGQTEIEVLSAPYPSIVIVLHGEEGTDARWVVIGEAIQSEPDFDFYRIGLALPTQNDNLIIVEGQEIATEELLLTINTCREVAQVNGQQPPGSNQRFVSCDVSLQAISTTTYSGEAIAITEFAWAQSSPDWLPYQGVSIQVGELNPGEVTAVTVTGVVNKSSELAAESRPVLMWQRAEDVYLVELEIE